MGFFYLKKNPIAADSPKNGAAVLLLLLFCCWCTSPVLLKSAHHTVCPPWSCLPFGAWSAWMARQMWCSHPQPSFPQPSSIPTPSMGTLTPPKGIVRATASLTSSHGVQALQCSNATLILRYDNFSHPPIVRVIPWFEVLFYVGQLDSHRTTHVYTIRMPSAALPRSASIR